MRSYSREAGQAVMLANEAGYSAYRRFTNPLGGEAGFRYAGCEGTRVMQGPSPCRGPRDAVTHKLRGSGNQAEED